MAKTIKFNLIIDGNPIRSIKDLQESFSIEDVLDFYHRGMLQKWLKVRGYEDYLKKVEAIKPNKSAIIELIKIFDVELDEQRIKEDVYALEFMEKRKAELARWEQKDTKAVNMINEYNNSYEQIKKDILEHKEDMPYLKVVVQELSTEYKYLFSLDYWKFFWDFKDTVPLVIYAILMNCTLRDYFLNDLVICKELKKSFTLADQAYKKEVYNYLPFVSIFGEKPPQDDGDKFKNKVTEISKIIKVFSFAGQTDGYWKDLVEKDVKVMILSMPSSSLIASPVKKSEELNSKDVSGNFVILNGLLYKSKTADECIIYMEI